MYRGCVRVVGNEQWITILLVLCCVCTKREGHTTTCDGCPIILARTVVTTCMSRSCHKYMRYPICSRGRGLFSSNEKLIASKDYIFFFHKKIIFGNNKVFLGRENRDYRCVASEYSLTKSLYSEGLSNLRFFCFSLCIYKIVLSSK